MFDDTRVSAAVPRKAQEGCLGGGGGGGGGAGPVLAVPLAQAAGSELRLSSVPFSLWCLFGHRAVVQMVLVAQKPVETDPTEW